MRALGIDYGGKRIGLAISDAGGEYAFPREMIANDSQTLTKISALVDSEKIGSIAMGDTRSYSDRENPVTKEAEKFAAILKEKTGITVTLVREAGTSIEASRFAPENDQHSDAVAAAIILQRFLDTKKV